MGKSRRGVPDLAHMPPDSLEVSEFRLGADEYAVLSFPLTEPALPAELTPTEQHVVRRLLLGESPADIAKARGTSVNTVHNQIRSIYDKLGVHSRDELIQRCR